MARRDPVTHDVALAVLRRDAGCVAPRLGGSYLDCWGRNRIEMGGPLIAESRQAKETKYQHEYKARLFVRCETWMPLSQERCGRREGHKTKCGTTEAVQRENARRRASHAVERGQLLQIVENPSTNPWMRLGDKALADKRMDLDNQGVQSDSRGPS